jgi:hypothetical protein
MVLCQLGLYELAVANIPLTSIPISLPPTLLPTSQQKGGPDIIDNMTPPPQKKESQMLVCHNPW